MWFKVNDALPDTRSAEDAMELCPWSLSVWTLAGAKCSQKEIATGGVVDEELLRDVRRRASLSPAQLSEAISALVTSGLWHDSKTLRRCDDCAGAVKLKTGSYFFHMWWDGNPTSEAVEVPLAFRMWKLRDDLKRDRKLCDLIEERDQGMCRYCGIRVRWSDKKGDGGGTRDHLSPYGGNTYDNVVIACRQCNGRKGHRTPEQWVAEDGVWDEPTNPEGGRSLLPEPVPYQSAPSRDLVEDQIGTGPHLDSRAQRARGGADRDGTGRDLVEDQVRPHRGDARTTGPGRVPAHQTNGSGER